MIYEMENPLCNFCGFNGPHTLIEKNVKNSEHDFVECPTCKLRFYSPRRTFKSLLDFGFGKNEGAKKEAEFFYQNLNFMQVTDRDKQEIILRSYYGRMFDLIQHRNQNIKSLFEVGCTVGFFLKLAKERGMEIGGCELNHYAVDVGEKYFGLSNVHKGPFCDFSTDKKYDCVVALDYIEHTYTPFDDLKKLNSMLNPGGILLLKTFLEEKDLDKDMVCPPYHSHHFFSGVLNRMIVDSGFIIEDWIPEYTEQIIVIGVKK